MPRATPPRKPERPHERARDQGAVLVVVLLVMLGLLGLGMTALWMTSGNLQVGTNVNLRSNALYVAEAGIERAREILNLDPAGFFPDVALPGSGHPLDDIPSPANPNGIGAILVDSGGAPVADVAHPPGGRPVGAVQEFAATMGTYTVWIRNDAAEIRQGQFTLDVNRAVVIRSQGVASDGRTNVVIEVTMGTLPAGMGGPNIPGPPPPVLCNSGKNACDDNSSVQYGIVVN